MPVRKTPVRPSGPPKMLGVLGEVLCGFCETGAHKHCPVAVEKGSRGKTWLCPCAQRTPDRHPRYESVID